MGPGQIDEHLLLGLCLKRTPANHLNWIGLRVAMNFYQ